MPADQDLLYGRIAIEFKFCTAAQVDHCLALQAKSEHPMSLGHHLVREGFLTEDQHSKVLETQRRNLAKKVPGTQAPKSELLFGRLAVREGFATEVQVNAALREQGRPGERRTLGEILVARGTLTREQVAAILGRQSKWLMRCPKCAVVYTVHSTSKNPRKAACPRCRGPLEAEAAKSLSESDAELETSTRNTPPPPGRAGQSCRICGQAKLSVPASDGRVTCLSCGVRFVP
jgi:hypothetical protein